MAREELSALERFRRDRAKYPARPWLNAPEIWVVASYRLGQWLLEDPTPLRRLLWKPYRVLHLLACLATNVDLHPTAQIGPGLRIYHLGPVTINPNAVIGADFVVGPGTVVGNRKGPGCPRIGDGVIVGAGSQILGDITVGDGAHIGAMSLVIDDVPAGATVAGIPARVTARARA